MLLIEVKEVYLTEVIKKLVWYNADIVTISYAGREKHYCEQLEHWVKEKVFLILAKETQGGPLRKDLKDITNTIDIA